MGIPVVIIGESGSGKTYSIKNFDPGNVGILLCEKNRLPFQKKFKTFKVKETEGEQNGNRVVFRQGQIVNELIKQAKTKVIVIDDSQYIMANEFFDRAGEKGYDKFVDIGVHFRDIIHTVNNKLADDVIVYFLHHPEMDVNTGRMKAKTIGKMLDEKLTLEGCFDIVLWCRTDGKRHWFQTQGDGFNTAKSPEDMFDAEIPNDLAFVDKTIREYYGMEPLVNNKEKEGTTK